MHQHSTLPVRDCKATEWRPIPGFEEEYMVSSFGEVRSLDRISSGNVRRQVKGKILRPGVVSGGYLKVILSVGSRRRFASVHHLVLEAFVGPCPPGMECCHNDGNRQNNRLENLRWDTKKANQGDRLKHGTSTQGRGNGSCKLTEEQVREIRAIMDQQKQGARRPTARIIAAKYGLSEPGIMGIANRHSWEWLG